MSKHWSERVNRTGCVLDPPVQGRLTANIQPPHIKQSKPLKLNKHFDTCWVVKRVGLITQIMLQPKSCWRTEDKPGLSAQSRDAYRQCKKHNINVYSPFAVRLRTESKLCADGSSLCVVMVLTASEEKESEVLNERYSCIMY